MTFAMGGIARAGSRQQPTPTLLPGEFNEQRSLVGYSPWDHKESDTSEETAVATYKLKKWFLLKFYVAMTPGST